MLVEIANTIMQTRSKTNRQLTDDEKRVENRLEKRSYQEHPPAKGIQKKGKPIKKTKVNKSHKAIH